MAVAQTKLEEAYASAPQLPAAESESVDLRAYWRVVVRRRWLVIPFFVATVLVTTLVTLRQTSRSRSICAVTGASLFAAAGSSSPSSSRPCS